MRASRSSCLLVACLSALAAAQEPPLPYPSEGPPHAPPIILSGAGDGCAKNYDKPPRLIKQARPAYPKEAYEKRIDGTVIVEFTVDAQGKTSNLKASKSIPGLDEAALDCVRKWEFAPAMKDGRPVATTCKAPVAFKIY